MKNPIGFPWELGQYEEMGIVVPTVGPPPPAVQIECPGRVIVYAAAIALVKNCRGLAGFGANPWANPIVVAARGRADAFVKGSITCKDGCNKVANLIWIGWDCGGNPRTAVAAVEIAVDCILPDPSSIDAFKAACKGLKELPAPIFLGKGWSLPRQKREKKKAAKSRKPRKKIR